MPMIYFGNRNIIRKMIYLHISSLGNPVTLINLSVQINFWIKLEATFCVLNVVSQNSMQMCIFEPTHEILAHFVLRKFILQTRMCRHPVGLDVWFLVGPIVYFHTLCVRTAKDLVRVCSCAGSPEPSLVAYVISTIISWAGSFLPDAKQSCNTE